jgi:hypothetical protein
MDEFSIADVPSLDASHTSVYVDIGFLGGEAHTNAFIDIFEKFVRDNARTLMAFQSVVAHCAKPIGGELADMQTVLGAPRIIARQLYESYNDEVRLLLRGNDASAMLVVTFDNPSFRFEHAM